MGIDKNGALMNQTIDVFYDGDGDWPNTWRQFKSDTSFYCFERFILDAYYKTGQPVFHYVMTLPFSANDQRSGCTGPGHSDDIMLLLDNSHDLLPRTPAESALGRRMRGYWANFAKNNTPDAAWPAYGDPENRFYYNLSLTDTMAMQWQQAQCDFLLANEMILWKTMPCAGYEDRAVDIPF